ncbi:VTT domain-containing protein [Oscillospiraceae bacterium WX1]
MPDISIFDLLFHIDTFLNDVIIRYGVLVYILIFIILFCETGLFMPLPGDSLIFAGGAFAAAGMLDIWSFALICLAAGILGDSVNYYLGHSVGKKLYWQAKGRFLKRENIDRAKAFYERHGGKAIIFSRFIPLVRQCTPFVAGIGRMTFGRFMSYNLVGVAAWVGISSLLGYFFGNIPAVKDNFSVVILAIIAVSLLPAVIAFLKSKLKGAPKPE